MLDPTRMHIDGIHRIPTAEKQAVAVDAAKTEVPNQTGRGDASQQGPIRCNAVNAIPGTTPDVAVAIHTDAIGIAVVHPIKIASTRNLLTAILHIKHVDESIWLRGVVPVSYTHLRAHET